jgi:hypothetical protein
MNKGLERIERYTTVQVLLTTGLIGVFAFTWDLDQQID